MKIEQHEIARKLKQMKSVVPSKATLPSFEGILFSQNTLTANNLELAMTATLPIESAEEFILPKKAIEMIENLPDGEIYIHADGEKITIKSTAGTSCFQTVSVKDFPAVNKGEEAIATIFLDGEEIIRTVNQVLYAVQPSPTKPIMSGVYFEADGEYLNIVGCDGYRLAWNQLQYPEKFTAIIPKASLQKVFSIGFHGDLILRLNGEKNAVIQSGDYTCYTRLLEGQYINYRDMFNKEYPLKTAVCREALLNCVKRALICAGDKIAAPVVLRGNERTLTVSTQSEISDFSETIEIQGVIPEEMNFKIGFNGHYLSETLKAFAEETVELHYSTPLEAVRIYGEKMKALCLPVRLK
jgi:DNA polymerase-3 subunit beta